MTVEAVNTDQPPIIAEARLSVGAAIVRDPLALSAALWLALVALTAWLGPLIAPYGPNEIVRDEEGAVVIWADPSAEHWLGTTAEGRDVFSQLIAGARPVFIIGTVCSLVPVAIGYMLGLLAGYRRGAFNAVVSRAVEIADAIPSEPFAIVLLAMVGASYPTLILAISLTFWKTPVRSIRNLVLTLNGKGFITSARAYGASSRSVLQRHMIPITLPLALIYVPIGFASAVLAESALSFLGFGIPGVTSWGTMMEDAFEGGSLHQNIWWLLAPGIATTLTAGATFLFGRPVEVALDSRTQ